MKTILITGGAGYIGSHTVVEFIEQNYQVFILDNFSNSKQSVFARIKQISGVEPQFVAADINDKEALTRLFKQHEFEAVVHFAGSKAVGESVEKPLEYYHNNVAGSVTLLEVMKQFNCFKFVFSSSATVYGDPESVPIKEKFPLSATNPYGRTKLMIEEILRDLSHSDDRWQISILRYFNPIAAHQSGLIGEDPNGIPNNLMPFIAQVAVGKLPQLSVFGDDYDTPDGTGVRDYIHVVDLARAHVLALQGLDKHQGCNEYNIGTGKGYSVLEMVRAFEQASGVAVPYEIKGRRSGDIAECYADPSLSAKAIGWKAEYDLDKMVQDNWRWQEANPNGYEE